MADDNGTFDYVFGTPNGIFAVDTANGAILGLKKAASKAFDPASAGTYKALYYQKTGATTGPENLETGTPSLGKAAFVIGASGQVTMKDAQGNTVVQANADAGGRHQLPIWRGIAGRSLLWRVYLSG